MEYNILSTTPYQTVEQEDSSLAPGERRQEQNGYTGYKVATYRCVYDKDGNLISRTLEASSTYKSRNQIILVGPEKEETPTTPKPTEDPETPSQPTQETPSGQEQESAQSPAQTPQATTQTENAA